MRSTQTVGLALVGLLAVGCGSSGTDQRSDGGTGADRVPRINGCLLHASQIEQAATLTTATVRGRKVSIKLTDSDGEDCPNTLFGMVAGKPLWLDLGATTLNPESVQAIRPGTSASDVLAASEVRPGVGHQVHVYGLAQGALTEFERKRQPIVPIAPSDSRGDRVSADCSPRGITVARTVAHEPPGFVASYDVREATYSPTGRLLGDREVADNVLPGQLGTRFPDLAAQSMFLSCQP